MKSKTTSLLVWPALALAIIVYGTKETIRRTELNEKFDEAHDSATKYHHKAQEYTSIAFELTGKGDFDAAEYAIQESMNYIRYSEMWRDTMIYYYEKSSGKKYISP
jgi:hypothetical protein